MNNKDESASKSAEEIAGDIYRDWTKEFGIAGYVANNNYKENGDACSGITRKITQAILEAEKRGEDRVLSRTPNQELIHEKLFKNDYAGKSETEMCKDIYYWLTRKLKGE